MHKIKYLLVYKILNIVQYLALRFIKDLKKDIQGIIKDHYYEKKFSSGLETSTVFSSGSALRATFWMNLAIGEVNPYEPASYAVLEKIVNYLKLNQNDVFIDFGCGKGRVVFFVAMQKLKKVIGIELDEDLVDVANRNLNNLRINNTPIEIINADASTFQIKEGTVIYIYNSFGRKTIVKVIGNIKDSLAANPRKIRIMYYNPVHNDLFDNQDWLVPDGDMSNSKRENNRILVWHNK